MFKLGFYTTEDNNWEPILVSRKWSPAGTTDQVLSFTGEDGRRALVEADWALKLATPLTLKDLILELHQQIPGLQSTSRSKPCDVIKIIVETCTVSNINIQCHLCKMLVCREIHYELTYCLVPGST